MSKYLLQEKFKEITNNEQNENYEEQNNQN